MELDRQRAAGVQAFSNSIRTVADEIILLDLMLPAFVNSHWIVETASIIAGLSVRSPGASTGFPPNSGIFLCPPGTVVELAAESIAGINLSARPFLLPMGPPGAAVATVGAGAFPFTYAMTLAPGFKSTVPYGWFLRAIISCAQGSATPGPGAASSALFTALAYREKDTDELSASSPECR